MSNKRMNESRLIIEAFVSEKTEYEKRDDYENQTPYRQAVLRKQFELNKNPYRVAANHSFTTDEAEKVRQLAAANWEREREKYFKKYKNGKK